MQGGFKKPAGDRSRRLFIAVSTEPSENLVNMVSDFRKGLTDAKIKWSDLNNFHVTLAFLGETAETKIPGLGKMLAGISSTESAFTLIIRGAGVFRSLKDPRVLWTGIDRSENLESLFRKISSGLGSLDIVLEERTFRPHLTLGRIKSLPDPWTLETLLVKFRDKEIQLQPVSEIILYESLLRPEGPLYKPVGTYPLLPRLPGSGQRP
jgi:2'-5' RNA ligase